MKLSLLPALLASATLALLGGCVDPGYYGYAPGDGGSPTVIVGDAPAVIAPIYIAGYGTGYWYGGQFWPDRPGCSFYNGRYYGGQNWHGGSGWNGGGNSYTQNSQNVQNNYNVQNTRTVQNNSYNRTSSGGAQYHSGQPHQGGHPGAGTRPSSSHPVQTVPSHSGGQPRGGSQGQNKGGEEKKHKN